MASATVFIPRPDLTSKDNLLGFIESARRELQVFGADLNFDDHVWDVTDYLNLKGRGNKRTRINFFALSSGERGLPMREPFLSFAKAYCRYMHGLRPKKFINCRLYALKAVAEALEAEFGSAEVDQINGHVLDAAAAIIRRRYDEALAYRVGGDLELLCNFLARHALTAIPILWRNTLPRPSDAQRVGREFDERRAAKMPSQAALDALPKVFQRATESGDVLVASTTAILLAAPSRISEVLLLPTNCEITFGSSNDSRVVLRWWPSKGAPPMMKPVYGGMSDVVSEAIRKLKEITAPAREIATWYESKPYQLFLPFGTRHLRSQVYLTSEDVARIIGVDDGFAWCQHQQIEIARCGQKKVVRFEDVERRVLALLPDGFPFLNREIGLRYSEALFVVRQNELQRCRATHRCMIEPIPTDFVNDALGSKKDGRPSIFDRLGFSEPDGSPIRITTHQFRHFLNTIAQSGGLSNLDIAKWSGRLDLRQNAVYDHVSTSEMLIKIREAVGDSSLMFGPMGSAPDRRLISRSEFSELKVPTAHTTELGFCVHDFAVSPCELHRDCINCEELVCVKGDCVKSASIRRQLEETRNLLERARSADQAEQFGADRWAAHQQMTLKRLEQICSILDDSSVPPGTFITLYKPNSTVRHRLTGNLQLPVNELQMEGKLLHEAKEITEP